ncbi:MAG: leucine-rich repeat domain-containing protein, partial [Clostridia bacterium]|nr:leucine-rich repeat domain-containing protein [Clostridia bacterium]
ASNVTLGESAFYNCEKLATVNNLENASTIGAMAFQKTAITSVKLTNVTEIGDYAFGESKVTAVDFGTERKLVKLGENPFYGCEIDTFGKKTDEIFNQTVVGTKVQATYEISDKVKVIDGVLYQSVPNGLVLVSYPAGSAETTFVVPEGVVRISGSAFRSTKIENVTLPTTLKSLGDKAFYECENLLTVVFKSYEAPMLEEVYDEYYVTYEHMPLTGNYYGYDGLGIVPFYMWNMTSNFNNFFYGANFYNYVGRVDKTIVMVKPVNGQNYDSFIFSKYFSAKVEGNSAPMEGTVKVIAMIDALPARISLEHKDIVAAARAAFDGIASFDQKSLVSNISKLTAAEAMIAYLEYEANGGDKPTDNPDKPIVEKEEKIPTYVVILISVGATLLVAVAAFLAYVFLTKKKSAKVSETSEEFVDASQEDNQSQD